MVRYAALKGLYEIEKTIGCGGFAKVKLATHLTTNEKVAIKIMDKIKLGGDLHRVQLEIEALKQLSHQHICKLYQVIDTETHIFMVIEYCSGGELFDHIVEKNRLSESESRVFFRQIVSAVAYLHGLGYAHRDLKPENVLLDKDQNLKLIDFGLCAKPNGGITSPLYTSCGSPTYAAPELILGREYIGSEVDVWSMGVLLYALLSGYLPFDDQNIENLYKKILSGIYEEPFWMSHGSRRLIRSMLQVDPKKRIKVEELLHHRWLTVGFIDDMKIKSTRDIKDNDCIQTMAQKNKVSFDEMWNILNEWSYDYNTATYMLLVARKKRGLPLKLSSCTALKTCNNRMKLIDENVLADASKTPLPRPTAPKPIRVEDPSICTTPISRTAARSKENNDILSPSENFIPPRKPSSIRKPLKRIRTPNLDGDHSPDKETASENSAKISDDELILRRKRKTADRVCVYRDRKKAPVPSKITPGKSAERNSTPISGKRNPEDMKNDGVNSTPRSTRKAIVGSIERSFNKVRYVLTAKRQRRCWDGNDSMSGSTQPAVLTGKGLCNVSTTSSNNPDQVLSRLRIALQRKGITCIQKGYCLRGKLEPKNLLNATNPMSDRSCSFELEVCFVPTVGNYATKNKVAPVRNETGTSTPQGTKFPTTCVGIRRKRLKGDAWCYKKVCEEVLALAATDLQLENDCNETIVD